MKIGLQLIAVAAMMAVLTWNARAEVLRLVDRQFDPLIEPSVTNLFPSTGGPEGDIGDKGLRRTLMRFSIQETPKDYYVVQFNGPIRQEWRTSLEDLGAVVMDYLPDFAYIVRMSGSTKALLAGQDHVRWIGDYAPDWRISREAMALSNFGAGGDQPFVINGKVALRMDAFPGESRKRITEEIKALGGIVQAVYESGWGIRISATLDREKVRAAAKIPGMKWVEIRRPRRASNEFAAGITDVRPVRTRAGDLYGQGQIVAVSDSGLDKGSVTDIHPDFLDGYGNSRVLDIFAWGDDSFLSDPSGHGTHVAGSVLGNGSSSGSNPAAGWFPDTCHAGMAPKALLVFQALSNTPDSRLPGIPVDLKPLFQQALDAGACIHTNSWGTSGAGSYDGECVNVDQFCWTNKDFLILFAAGNNGYDKNMDGIIDRYSIDSPATAKNCLSVGASESLRAVGGFFDKGYGEFRAYAEPVASDFFSDNARGLAAFSSHGPCLDGRIKPDLVAPGTNILSTRSAVQVGNGWGGYDDRYYYSGGSSMATPITAGAAAVLREYLTGRVDQFRLTPPSSAMLKACLVNGAVDIAPGQYSDGEFKEIRSTPGPAAGWGRLSLDRVVAPEFPFFTTHADNAQGLETDEKAVYTVSGVSGYRPLRITLAWTDYPSTQAANGGLVNDLDLMVRDQNGQVFYPDNAQTQTGMSKALYVEQVSTTLPHKRVAIRLTPDAYPKRLSSLFWAGSNPNSIAAGMEVAVYGADSQGYPAGDALFSTTMEYCPSGEYALPVDVEVTKGDLVAVFTFSSLKGMALYAMEDGDPEGRGLVDRGNGWESIGCTPAVGGIFFSTSPSETFDRVNNLVGVTIEKPSGEYTVTVNGYNVPQGPQPFALVVSGTNPPKAPPRADIPFGRERR